MRTGSCNCGGVRITASGKPVRVGLCHCTVCRKESGAAYTAFAVWATDQVMVEGETQSWTATIDRRHFCPVCGSAVFSIAEGSGEVEVRLGVLDKVPGDLMPTYELWVVNRDPWLGSISGAEQFPGNRKPAENRQT